MPYVRGLGKGRNIESIKLSSQKRFDFDQNTCTSDTETPQYSRQTVILLYIPLFTAIVYSSLKSISLNIAIKSTIK
jgi:hypothetical protein